MWVFLLAVFFFGGPALFVASGAGSTGAAGDDLATANANAAPGATRPVDQHVEFVVKVIFFGRRRNAGGMGHCASKRSLAVLYLPSRFVQYAHQVFAPLSQSVVSGGGL